MGHGWRTPRAGGRGAASRTTTRRGSRLLTTIFFSAPGSHHERERATTTSATHVTAPIIAIGNPATFVGIARVSVPVGSVVDVIVPHLPQG